MLETFITRAESTATLARAYDLEYLVPGLLGELGEAYGKIAKAYRDSWGPTDTADAVAQELGDVAWFAAMLIAATRRQGVTGDGHIHPARRDDSLPDIVADLVRHYENSAPASILQDDAFHVWHALHRAVPELSGLPLEHALHLNTTKLRSRAGRGVLAGSGDTR